MGTSTSSRGPGSNSPLVPPWADVDGLGPGSTPPPDRFRAFRTALGKFVSSGEDRQLRKALGHYARTSTGGSTDGARRFGAMARSGGALFDTLSALRGGGNAQDVTGVNLSGLSGADTDIAIEAIVDALAVVDGDADRVRAAMTEALSECLEGLDEFDFAHISDEMLVAVMLAYTRNCIFVQIMLDSRDAFSKAAATGRLEQAEQALRELIRSVTDKHMGALLDKGAQKLDGKQMEGVQLRAIREVWSEWEAYEP